MLVCVVTFGPLLTLVTALAFGFGWDAYRNHVEGEG